MRLRTVERLLYECNLLGIFSDERDPPIHSVSGASDILGVSHLSTTQHNDLICTTPRLCQNNMTPVAVRGRGTTSAYNCFPATGLYFKSKVLASVGRGSTETARLQHGSSMFGDTHARGGGGI